MFKVMGVTLAVLAIAIAVVPVYTDCQSQGRQLTLTNGRTTPMKCHWAGVAEIGAGVPLFALGSTMVVSRRKESLRFLSIVGISLGAVAIAMPTALIGVCQSPMMTCVTLMRPALVSMGGLATGISLLGLVLSRRVTAV